MFRSVRYFRGVACVLAILVLLLSALPSRVEAQYVERQAAAEALFRDGRRLLNEGHIAQACRKFEASYELDVAVGTLLNLAACLEQEGRLASAWARFIEAETRAGRAGSRERQRVAHLRAAALESRLVRLRLVVPSPAPGMRIEVEGRDFGPALWNTAIPVDPGEMTITVSAAGYESWTHTVPAQEEGSIVEVEVPELTPEPPEEPDESDRALATEPLPLPSPELSGRTRSVRRIVGFTGVGAGVAALAVGLGLGQNARSLWNSVDCPVSAEGGRVCSSRQDQADAESAHTRANAATGMVVAGGAIAAAAVVVLLTGRHDDPEEGDTARVRVTPVAGANGAGILIGGAL